MLTRLTLIELKKKKKLMKHLKASKCHEDSLVVLLTLLQLAVATINKMLTSFTALDLRTIAVTKKLQIN